MIENVIQWYYDTMAQGNEIPVATAIIASLIVAFIMYAMVTLRKPEWFHSEDLDNIVEVRQKWHFYSVLSFVLSLLASFVPIALLVVVKLAAFTPFFAINTAAVTFIAVFSLLTDPKLRLVDRHILRVGMVLTLLTTSAYILLLSFGDLASLVSYGIILLIICIVLIFPIMGASDARAIFITYTSMIGFMSGFGITATWILAMLVAIGYALKKNNGNLKKAFLTKISLPLVPILLVPNAVLLVVSPLIAFFPLFQALLTG